MNTTATSEPGRCPDCKHPTNSDKHFACISKNLEEGHVVNREPATAPAAAGPDASLTVPGPTDAKTGWVERLIVAWGEASARKTAAKSAAAVAKINAKAARAKPEAKDAPAPDDEGTGGPEGMPWPVIAVLIPLGALFWAIFFSGATFGQGLMLSHPKTTAMLAEHVEWTLDLTTGMIIGGVIEFAAVFFLFLSIARRIANDGGTGSLVVSYVFAVISISINVFGHAWIGDTLGMVVFGFFSVTAFLGLAQVSDFAVRQIQRKRGLLDHTPPRLGFHFTRKHPDLVLRYRAAYIANPKLGKQGALEVARKEKKKEEDEAYLQERITAIVKALKQMSNVRFPNDPVLAELWYLRRNPRLMAERLIAITDNEAAVAELDGLMVEVEARIAAEKVGAAVTEYVESIAPKSGPNNGTQSDRNDSSNASEGRFRKTRRMVNGVFGWGGSNTDQSGTPNNSDADAPNGAEDGPRIAIAAAAENGSGSGNRPGTESARTETDPFAGMTREQRKAATMQWLLPILQRGEKVTNKEIEIRLGFDPERSKGTNGRKFREEALVKLNEIASQQEGVKL